MRKRVFLFLFAMAIVADIHAQQGRHGIGVELLGSGMISKPVSIGAMLKYQYGLSDLFRVEPFFVYYFSESGIDESSKDPKDSKKYPRMTGGLNLHTLFYKGNRIWSYLITGASYSHLRYQPRVDGYVDPSTRAWISPDKFELSENKFGGNFGLGLDYRASYNINIVLELGYNTTSKEFAGIGFVYNFEAK